MNDGELLNWLMTWYESQCDGNWEHSWGVRIGTLDNPGWSVRINLAETDWHECPPQSICEDLAPDRDWISCRVVLSDEGPVFEGFCGPANLGRVIERFRRLIESLERKDLPSD